MHRVRYEDLVSDPVAVLHGIAAFADLTPDPRLAGAARARGLRSENSKWRAGLDDREQHAVTALIHEPPLCELLEVG